MGVWLQEKKGMTRYEVICPHDATSTTHIQMRCLLCCHSQSATVHILPQAQLTLFIRPCHLS
jgi:hypothetical protein